MAHAKTKTALADALAAGLSGLQLWLPLGVGPGFALEIERHLDDVLVRLSGADDAAVGKDGSSRRCCLGPLYFFDDLRVCLVDDRVHYCERLSPQVP